MVDATSNATSAKQSVTRLPREQRAKATPSDHRLHHRSADPPRCARCGEQRQAGSHGFRFFRHGIAYCDTCITLSPTWVVGPGWTRLSPAVVEGF